MNNIKKAAKYVSKHPDTSATTTFLELATALESGGSFSLVKLYELDHNEFVLAMGVIDDWRLDRYYTSKLSLLGSAEINDPPSAK